MKKAAQTGRLFDDVAQVSRIQNALSFSLQIELFHPMHRDRHVQT